VCLGGSFHGRNGMRSWLRFGMRNELDSESLSELSYELYFVARDERNGERSSALSSTVSNARSSCLCIQLSREWSFEMNSGMNSEMNFERPSGVAAPKMACRRTSPCRSEGRGAYRGPSAKEAEASRESPSGRCPAWQRARVGAQGWSGPPASRRWEPRASSRHPSHLPLPRLGPAVRVRPALRRLLLPSE
jgi:hypothetical protein